MLYPVRYNINRFYVYTTLFIAACWVWLVYALSLPHGGDGISVCLFKHVTSVPCPSCGTTRSVIAICNGEWLHALWLNPIGYIAIVFVIVIPIWLLFDATTGKQTVYAAFLKFNTVVKQKPVLITLLSLIAINWIWNLYKM